MANAILQTTPDSLEIGSPFQVGNLSTPQSTTLYGNIVGSADLTIDSGTLKVDSANNRVGINQLTPTVALDVVGVAKVSGGLILSDWAGSTLYTIGCLIKRGNTFWLCGQTHTSHATTFSIDWLTNGYWIPQGLSPGDFVYWGNAATKAGYLICNGQTVSRTTYADLFAVLGTTFGSGNGSTTFNLPDPAGLFIRCAGTNTTLKDKYMAGNYFTATHGFKQQDQMQGHYHPFGANTGSNSYNGTGGSLSLSNVANVTPNNALGAPITDGTNGTPSTGAETRPANLSLTLLVKY